MTPIDWVGLWAALQVIGILLGLALFAVLFVGGIVYIFGGMALDAWRDRRRKR